MKTFLLKNLTLFFIAILFFSCSNDGDNVVGKYPKNVNITYKVYSSKTNAKAQTIAFTNDTDGTTTLNNEILPFTKTISKKVSFGSAFVIGAYGFDIDLTIEILVDNKIVEIKTFDSSSSIVGGSIVHSFQ